MTTPAQLPDAWLGLAPQFAPRKCVRICMDCADKPRADELAREMGWEATHTLCQKHLEQRRKEIHESK